ncbi:ROK family protein [Saccharothrix sp. S26]|uniref:ROK family protein n=1 Tax=Saccharothrix sp. S26 TaxID=2907215 RepID=UPI001F2C4165|nr:ROK family protein [Saccharothrix sp. S26]MCE6996160.1 ROK family protein [Saccharothrix sp. S26]
MARPTVVEASGAGAQVWPRLSASSRAALRLLLTRGGLPRAEMARMLGLSRTSLTRVTRELLGVGLVREGVVELRATTGRPSEVLEPVVSAHHFLGVKLTGDALYSVVTDLSATVQGHSSAALVAHDVVHVVAQIADHVKEVRGRFPRLTSVGISLAGVVTGPPGGEVVHRSPFLGWTGDVPLAQLVARATGCPVVVENDVSALTALEAWSRVGAGVSSMALVTIGTGLGFGFVVDGRVVRGAHGAAGRLDHVVVVPDGPVCEHGHQGCASALLNNGAVVRNAGSTSGDYAAVIEAARAGDGPERRAVEAAGVALGRLIGLIQNTVDPEKVVLTGDGLDTYRVAADVVHAEVERIAEGGPGTAVLDVQAFDFSEWARAAAGTAIFSLLT